MAIRKEKSELEIIAQKIYASLSYKDQSRIDELLDNRDY